MTASPRLRLGTPEGRWVVGAMVLGSVVTFVAASVVNIALPAIEDDFDADFAGLQWVSNGYLVTLASLILVAGSIGDIHGRRRAFTVGLVVFAAASLLCAIAPNLVVLTAGRLVQGVGAALVTPASLALLDAAFHPDDKSRAIASWASGSALASAAGPFVGGWLVDQVSWRWIFVVLVPPAAVAGWAAVRHVPDSRDDTPGRRLDVVGAVLATGSIVGVVVALVQGPVDGWDAPLVIGAMVIGVCGSVAFVLSQRHGRDPMMPLSLFSSAQFSGANVFTLLVYFAIGGAFFFTALQFQRTVGYSALEAGAALVPMNVIMIVGSPRIGGLSGRLGPRWFVAGGAATIAVGLAWLAMVAGGSGYWLDVLPPVLVLGVGITVMVAPLTAAVMGSVPEHEVGMASAVNNAVARTGSLLSVAVLPAIVGLSGEAGGEELSDGYRLALLISAALCVVGAFVAMSTIGRGADLHTAHAPEPTSGCAQRSVPVRSG